MTFDPQIEEFADFADFANLQPAACGLEYLDFTLRDPDFEGFSEVTPEEVVKWEL